MKKSFKRAGVAVLSMAMLLSMGAVGAMTANAATNYSVAAAGKLTSASKYYVYEVADNLGNLASGVTLPGEANNDISYYQGKGSEATEVKKLAAHLAGIKDSMSLMNNSGTALGSSVSLEDGYYLVIVEPNSVDTMVQPMLVQVKNGNTSDVASTAKVQDLTLTKAITDVNDSTDKATTASTNATATKDSTAVAGVGDTVSYTINTSMPKYAPEAAITTLPYIMDTPVNIKDNVSTVVVNAGSTTLVKDTDYTISEEGNGFKVEFKKAAVQNHGSEAITVTYDATVLNTANQGSTGNDNTAKLVYNNDYLTGSNPSNDGKEVEDEAEVFTAPLKIHKTDGTNGLKGVSFTLKNSDGNYVQTDGTVIGSTDTDKTNATYSTGTSTYADIVYNRLKDGTYTLTEEQGVDGNRKLVSAVTVVITAGKNTTSNLYDGTYTYKATATDTTDEGYITNNDTVVASETVTISNPPYNELPGTGGMGTVLFTVGGAAIVLLAGALFVVYLRKRKTEE